MAEDMYEHRDPRMRIALKARLTVVFLFLACLTGTTMVSATTTNGGNPRTSTHTPMTTHTTTSKTTTISSPTTASSTTTVTATPSSTSSVMTTMTTARTTTKPACDIPGRYGDACQFQCSKTCSEVTCDDVTGVCLHGCLPGWSGEKCLDHCTNGYYGRGCSQQCSQHCLHDVIFCLPQNGTCTVGCEEGWSGHRCDIPPPEPVPVHTIGLGLGLALACLLAAALALLLFRRHRSMLREQQKPDMSATFTKPGTEAAEEEPDATYVELQPPSPLPDLDSGTGTIASDFPSDDHVTSSTANLVPRSDPRRPRQPGKSAPDGTPAKVKAAGNDMEAPEVPRKPVPKNTPSNATGSEDKAPPPRRKPLPSIPSSPSDVTLVAGSDDKGPTAYRKPIPDVPTSVPVGDEVDDDDETAYVNMPHRKYNEEDEENPYDNDDDLEASRREQNQGATEGAAGPAAVVDEDEARSADHAYPKPPPRNANKATPQESPQAPTPPEVPATHKTDVMDEKDAKRKKAQEEREAKMREKKEKELLKQKEKEKKKKEKAEKEAKEKREREMKKEKRNMKGKEADKEEIGDGEEEAEEGIYDNEALELALEMARAQHQDAEKRDGRGADRARSNSHAEETQRTHDDTLEDESGYLQPKHVVKRGSGSDEGGEAIQTLDLRRDANFFQHDVTATSEFEPPPFPPPPLPPGQEEGEDDLDLFESVTVEGMYDEEDSC